MYTPPSFAETRPEVMHALMRQYPLGTLVTLDADGLTANHLPFAIDPRFGESGVLRAHAARNNPFWHNASRDIDALIIFQGPQAYISPSWYPSKHENGKAVPTWNYITVHAYGPVKLIEDPQWLRNQLGQLTQQHEAKQLVPWRMDEAPPGYIDQLLTMIVGIEIPIRRLNGKWKASQNQPAANREGVVNGLRQQTNPQAHAMAAVIASQ